MLKQQIKGFSDQMGPNRVQVSPDESNIVKALLIVARVGPIFSNMGRCLLLHTCVLAYEVLPTTLFLTGFLLEQWSSGEFSSATKILRFHRTSAQRTFQTRCS